MKDALHTLIMGDYNDALEAVKVLDNDQRLELALALERFDEALTETRRERGIA